MLAAVVAVKVTLEQQGLAVLVAAVMALLVLI